MEDSLLNARDLMEKLIALPYEVLDVKTSAEQALDYLTHTKPDLILMDIVLKGEMDGVQAAEIIKEKYSIPVIFITADADLDYLKTALKSNPYGYIIKPVNTRTLQPTIKLALHNHFISEQLNQKKQWLSTLLNSINDAVFAMDNDKVITFFNPAAEKLFKMNADQVLEKPLNQLINSTSISSLLAELDQQINRLSRLEIDNNSRIKTVMENGGKKVYEQTITTIKADNKERVGFIIFIRDITERKEREEIIKKSEELSRALLNAPPDTTIILDLNGKILSMNETAAIRLGKNISDLIGKNVFDILPPEVSEYRKKKFQEIIDTKQSVQFQDKRADYHFDNYGYPILGSDGKVHQVALFARDITDKKAAEEKLMLASRVFDNTSEGICITDVQGTIQSVNPAFTKITGYTPEEVIGENPRILKSQHHSREFYKRLWKSLLTKGYWEGEIWNRRKNGEAYPEWLTINSIKDAEGNIKQFVALFNDISELRRIEEEIKHQAYHDPLTNLPNRFLFNDRLETAISKAHLYKRQLAILFLDLDRFKYINDTLGHPFGDKLLKKTAQILSDNVKEGDTVARMGGDEFTIILSYIDHLEDAAHAALSIINALKQPFIIDNHEVFISASLGISLYPDDGMDVKTLLKNADMALYRAKESGRNTYHFYTNDLNEKMFNRLKMENDLRKAVENKEFILYYQPQVSLKTGKIIGVEALIRWIHPVDKLIPPNQFIPIAEEIGIIKDIGEWVLYEACEQNYIWNKQFNLDIPVAVNISALQFEQEDFVYQIEKLIHQTGIKPQNLELEITENLLMKQTKKSIGTMNMLKDLGVFLSIDDFGTGYSSFNYLRHFPADKLKIDISFVREITKDPKSAAIASSIINIAHNLDMLTIAEGVETPEQLNFLKLNQCDQIQGYIFSAPMKVEFISKDLMNNRKLEFNDIISEGTYKYEI